MNPIVVLDGVTKLYRSDRRRAKLRAAVPLSHSQGRPIRAIDDVSLVVERGESVGLLGRNGAGKSTLLKLIAGVTQPTSGSIETHGRIASLIGLGVGFHAELTGAENLRFTAALMGMDGASIDRHYDQMVAFANIGPFIDQRVRRYSAGMKARLGFALASHVPADLLLVDEALAVGDASFRQKCLDRMRDINDRGAALLIVSHNAWIINELCDRALIMEHGQIIADGHAPAIVDTYATLMSGESDADEAVTLGDLELSAPTLSAGDVLTITATMAVKSPVPGAALRLVVLGPWGKTLVTDVVREASAHLERAGTYEISGVLDHLPIQAGTFRIVLEVARGENVLARSSHELEVTGIADPLKVSARWRLDEGVGVATANGEERR